MTTWLSSSQIPLNDTAAGTARADRQQAILDRLTQVGIALVAAIEAQLTPSGVANVVPARRTWANWP